jgi:hypothetical protein
MSGGIYFLFRILGFFSFTAVMYFSADEQLEKAVSFPVEMLQHLNL